MYRAWLIPYLEGTLTFGMRRELEARLAEDAPLAAELEAVRLTLPKLQAAAVSAAFTGTNDSLWPDLRVSLVGTRPERPRLPRWGKWIGLALLLGLIASSVDQQVRHHTRQRADLRLQQEMIFAPRVVFGGDHNSPTPMAAKLEERAHHVATERQAVKRVKFGV